MMIREMIDGGDRDGWYWNGENYLSILKLVIDAEDYVYGEIWYIALIYAFVISKGADLRNCSIQHVHNAASN